MAYTTTIADLYGVPNNDLDMETIYTVNGNMIIPNIKDSVMNENDIIDNIKDSIAESLGLILF